MKYYIVLICLLLIGCGKSPMVVYDSVYECNNKEIVVDKMNECIKNGNPLSDEEGEDLVIQCEESIKRILCERVIIKNTYEGGEIKMREKVEFNKK